MKCPTCGTDAVDRIDAYHKCPNCNLWFQSPFPPKVFHDPSAPVGMSDADKQVNANLASMLYDRFKPVNTLDIGCAYPYLGHCFKVFGCEAIGIDGYVHPHDLDVVTMQIDFDGLLEHTPIFKNDLITMIHNFEHHYDPVASFVKMHGLLRMNGHIFMRIPDHTVSGWENHLKPDIHPYFHCVDSIAELCAQTGLFEIQNVEPMEGAGQVDITLGAL